MGLMDKFKKGLLDGGGVPYTTTLIDNLNVALAAGAINGTLATDGINSRTVVDTTSKLAETVANGLEFTGASATGDPGIWWSAQTRAGGLTAFFRVKAVSGTIAHRAGWDTNQSGDIVEGIYFVTGGIRAYYGGNQRNILSSAYVVGTSYDFAISYRFSGGVWIWIRGGVFTDWTLGFVSNLGTTSPVYPAAIAQLTGVFYVKPAKTGVLPNLNTQYAGAADRKAVSVANDTLTAASGDGFIEHTITAATGVTQELMVRRTDDNNCVIIRMDFTGATIKVYEKNAGVETEKTGGTTAQTWVNGQAYRIQVSLYGTFIRTTVDLSSRNDATGSGFNASVTGVKVSHAGADLIAWPINPTGVIKTDLDAFFP